MDIQTIAIDKLNPARYNPRKDLKPGDIEYKKLKKSILEFDYIDPIIWNKRSGNIVGGHQRYKILKELGYEEIEVSVVDLDDVKEKALNISLNKNMGEWDNVLLKDILQELDTGEIDIEITGFDDEEIEELMNQNYNPVDIDELLKELDVNNAIEKPIWATIRTNPQNQELLEKALIILENAGIRVERSYET